MKYAEIIAALTKELDVAFDEYERAERDAEQAELAVRGANSALEAAKVRVKAAVKRHERVQAGLQVLNGESVDVKKVASKYSLGEISVEENSPEQKSAAEKPADGACLADLLAGVQKPAPEPVGNTMPVARREPLKQPGILPFNRTSMRATDPEKFKQLMDIVNWFVSGAHGGVRVDILATILPFFATRQKATDWLNNVLLTGVKERVYFRIEHGVYRAKDFTEQRKGGARYALCNGRSVCAYLDVPPGIEGQPASLRSMIRSALPNVPLAQTTFRMVVDQKNTCIFME